MGLLTKKNDELNDFNSINYFVKKKISKGEKCEDSELWAKEWLDNYVNNHPKKQIKFYKAYHTIPLSIQRWENKPKTDFENENRKKRKTDISFKIKAKQLLGNNRYDTLIDFESLKPEEYKIIVRWFEGKEELPQYLKGILVYQPTIKEKFEDFIGLSFKELIGKVENYSLCIFLAYLFMMLILINL